MSEPTPPAPDREQRRWRLLFQRSSEPLFLLNRQRRVLSVNQACEACLGLDVGVVRGLVCSARSATGPATWNVLAAALRPPPEVIQGSPGHVRRFVSRPGTPREWWDIDYFPLRDRKGRLRILGKISRALVEEADDVPLPATLSALRERADREFSMDSLASSVPALRRIANQVRLAAQCRTPVLLIGEIGTGKEWLARVIHLQGSNRERNFAAVDCASLSPPLQTEMLFGHGGLAASPAIGTLFFRDIDKLARELQDRLNDCLEGAAAVQPRVMASCCADPAEAVRGGRLLESLYCTLGTLVISAPPLRERLADLPALAARLLERGHSAPAAKAALLAPAALQVLSAYSWPGNLRELFAVLERAQANVRGERISVQDLPLALRLAAGLERASSTPRPLALDGLLEQVERRLIALALRRAGGNKSRAAEYLSIWRARLLRRMETLGLSGPQTPSPS